MNITRAHDGMLTYRYACGPDMAFRFHTLAEVGCPYQPDARALIARNGWRVEFGRSIDRAPWVADFIMEDTV